MTLVRNWSSPATMTRARNARVSSGVSTRGAVSRQRGHERLADGRDDDQVVLGSADQPVVERLAQDDALRGVVEVGVSADERRRVAGADADGRRAGP